MIGPKVESPAALRREALNGILLRAWCLLLLLPATTTALVAQGGCQPNTVVNRVAVMFLAGKEKIPTSLWLVNDGTSRRVRLQVTDRGDGFWTCESCDPLIGTQHQLRPELKIPGYSVSPARGVNRVLGGNCYAFFSFRMEKTAWALEVLPKPLFPFRFKTSGDNYLLRSPRAGGSPWNLVEGLSLADVVSLKIYEFQGNKAIYLFSLDVLSQPKELHQSLDQIADLVLQARVLYRYGNKQLPEDLDPEDPYLEIARQQKSSNSEQSNQIAKLAVKGLLRLKGLDLRDKTEVEP